MELIMKNPTERELVRARMDAMIDQRTMIKSAERRGRAEGRAEGQIATLAGLVKDGLLPIAEAAKRSNMTIKEFAQKAGRPLQQ